MEMGQADIYTRLIYTWDIFRTFVFFTIEEADREPRFYQSLLKISVQVFFYFHESRH